MIHLFVVSIMTTTNTGKSLKKKHPKFRNEPNNEMPRASRTAHPTKHIPYIAHRITYNCFCTPHIHSTHTHTLHASQAVVIYCFCVRFTATFISFSKPFQIKLLWMEFWYLENLCFHFRNTPLPACSLRIRHSLFPIFPLPWYLVKVGLPYTSISSCSNYLYVWGERGEWAPWTAHIGRAF